VKARKGLGDMPIKIIVGFIIALAIAALFAALAYPAISDADEAASCAGLLRNVGSVIADATGRSIC